MAEEDDSDKKPTGKNVSIRFRRETAALLERAAERFHCTKSVIIHEALDRHLADIKRERAVRELEAELRFYKKLLQERMGAVTDERNEKSASGK